MSSKINNLTESGEALRSQMITITSQIDKRLKDSATLTDSNLINEVEVFTAKLIALRQNPYLLHLYARHLEM